MAKELKQLSKSERVMAMMKDMKYMDLKRALIMRGLPFEELAKMDIPKMTQWLIDNWELKLHKELLNDYDDWVEKYLSERGADPLLTAPEFRLGFIAEKDDEGNTISTKRIKGLSKNDKVKRKRTTEGIFAGTKKAYTFELVKEGIHSKDEIAALVMEKFPEASLKSINVWVNKAKKKLKPNE